jgi:hypothetical protein
MVNFAEAYKSGLNAANKAKKSKEEINLIFNELRKQILEATEGKISMMRTRLPEPPKLETVATPKDIFKTFDPGSSFLGKSYKSNSQSDEEKIYHWAIAAENLLVKNSEKELARWSQDRNGYPCKITLDSATMYCEDKKGLENALAKLLSDPVVGETLYKLQNLPLPEQVSTKATAD